MMVSYPRNRKQQFGILILLMGLFIAGFFWPIFASDAIHHYAGIPQQTAGMFLFSGNILAIAFSGMLLARRWREQIMVDLRQVWKMPHITAQDMVWLEDNCSSNSYTVHAVEGTWPAGETARRPADLHVEFHGEDERVLFEIVRRR